MSRAVPDAAGPRRPLLPTVAGLLVVAVVAAACWQTPIARPAAPVAEVARPVGPAAEPAGVAVGASQRFDVPGLDTPFAIGIHGDAAGRAPELIAGGPTGAGQAMRLAFDAPVPTQN